MKIAAERKDSTYTDMPVTGLFRILPCLRECSLFTREGDFPTINYMYQHPQYMKWSK